MAVKTAFASGGGKGVQPINARLRVRIFRHSDRVPSTAPP
jgi:hypothetical protein